MKLAKLTMLVCGICVWSAFAGVASAQDQVSDVKVFHNAGQTFITWKEPGTPAVADDSNDVTMQKARSESKLKFNVYRSDKKIESVAGMTPVGQAGPLSCWNWTFHGAYDKNNKDNAAKFKGYRYVIKEEGEPLANGTGLYVHNPKAAGKAYYAVTMVNDGKENPAVTAANSTADAVDETVGQGVPVLQSKEKKGEFEGVKNPELHLYVRWEAPPNASKENFAIDYVVGVPSKPAAKAPVSVMLHCWGGSHLRGYSWWLCHLNKEGTYMIAPNQQPYDWWTGYNEFFWDTEGQKDEQKMEKWKTGKIYPYTTNRVLSFLDWAAEKYDLDLTRVGTGGVSMGGSGSPMFAIRFPERVAWCVSRVGVHNPNNTPQYKGGYEKCWGKSDWALPYVDGTNVWDFYNDVWYLKKNPQKSVGLISFANGKNDLGIGWPQSIEFLRALQETKQPHLFRWGMGDHGQRAAVPGNAKPDGETVISIDITVDRSLPAFTNCSLDDNPGTGAKADAPKKVVINKRKDGTEQTRDDIFDGDSVGQINLFMYWKTDDIVDDADRWEMTISIRDDRGNTGFELKSDECTVDITPRRCQQFKPKAGEKFKWTNKASDGKETTGEVTADQNGLVTITKAVITKAGNRISISR